MDTNLPQEHLIAWAAGLFEGEGCFGERLSKMSTAYYPSMQMSTTDPDVLETFVRVVGCGKVHKTKAGNKPTYKQKYQWRIEGKHVFRLYGLFRPYLHSRRLARIEGILDHVRETSCKRVATVHKCATEGCEHMVRSKTYCNTCGTRHWREANPERNKQLKHESYLRTSEGVSRRAEKHACGFEGCATLTYGEMCGKCHARRLYREKRAIYRSTYKAKQAAIREQRQKGKQPPPTS